MSDYKAEFLELLRSTERAGVEDMISYLEENDFFSAPASANHHLNHQGGLVEHSVNTCKAGLAIWEAMTLVEPTLINSVKRDNVIIATLLHDLCKTDIYVRSVMKRKTSIGTWEASEGYKVNYKKFPMGHGEKSVIMILFTQLDITDEEMLAIRWHMGAWGINMSSYEDIRSYDTACKNNPLVPIVQCADLMAASILERDTEGDD